MGFVVYLTRFPTVQKFENLLTFDKVTESLKVRTLRHSVYLCVTMWGKLNCKISKDQY